MNILEILVMVGQFILALSILITLHELGHFLTARWFKIRVDKFYLFFDFLFPLPNVLNFALFKIKKGDTEYGLGWFPLGGYVQIAGMIDESLEIEKLKEPAKPDEFRSKPTWQRLIVMLGGIIVNVITGVVIFIFVTWYYGESYQAIEKVPGIKAHKIAQEMGLKTGDKIVAVNGKTIKRFDEVLNPKEVLLHSGSFYTVERDGKQIDVKLPNDLMDKFADGNKLFIEPLYTFSVGEVVKDSPSERGGLLAGDRIVKIGSYDIKYFQDVEVALCHYKGKLVDITINRKNETKVLQTTINSKDEIIEKQGLLGFKAQRDEKPTVINYSFGESVVKGTGDAFNVIAIQLQAFGKIFTGQVSARKSLSGPVGLANLFGPIWDWERFWRLTGMLSMVLAFMNLLPIPALDGGHVLFLLLEMIMGRKLSDKFMIGVQQVGTVLILGLTVFAFANDLFKPKPKKYTPCEETAIVLKTQYRV